MKRSTLLLTSLSLPFFCCLSQAATLKVNNGSVAGNCQAGYHTIQSAVNAAQSGDTVTVCNGIYNEQVEIQQSIALNGQPGATIRPINAALNASDPDFPDPTAAIVYVHDASNVSVSGLIIDGSQANVNNNGCSVNFYGLYYLNASGSMSRNAVKFIEQDAALFGCQNALAIYAEDSNGSGQNLLIQANSVHDFQKNGITVIGPGLTSTITGNTVAGIGPTPIIAQNGIQVGPGGTATVSSNNVSNLVYSVCTDVANCGAATSGIIVYDSANVLVTGNTIQTTQGAIVPYDDEGNPLNTTITSNRVSGTQVFDGIQLYGDGNLVGGNNTTLGNTITNSGESGIYVSGNNNSIKNNTVVDAPIGVIDAGTGTTVTGEKNYDVPIGVQTTPPAPARIGRVAAQPRR